MNRFFEVVSDEYRKNGGEIKIPTRSNAHSAGYDFYSPVDITIPPHGMCMIWTDIKACMNNDEVLMLYVRSSMGKHPVVIANGTGVIDADYYNNPSNEGEIFIQMVNASPRDVVIAKGERIGQGIFMPYLLADGDLGNANQRTAGFGSTGVK